MSDERYKRQIALPEIGKIGQQLLGKSQVAVIGAGGLGCPCLVYLAEAGVGHITVCDGDKIDITNFNRQFLYREEDIGKNKASVAAQRLAEINPHIDITAVTEFLTAENAQRIIGEASLVIDCLDSYADRLILNDACIKIGVTFIHAGVSGISGQLAVCVPGKTPCLRCMGISEELKESNKGIIGATAGVLGSMQALEAIKILGGNAPSHGLLFFDGQAGEFDRLNVSMQSGCICGKK